MARPERSEGRAKYTREFHALRIHAQSVPPIQEFPMTIEHLALNVPDPVAMAAWYGKHLGMRIARKVQGPTHTHFVADAAGRTVLELYYQTKAPIPDYRAMDPFVFHIAFMAEDVAAERKRLLDAGATSEGDVVTTDAGDVMTFVRDPWGVTVQLVKRAKALMG
jgi:glyoxylase I family protein